MPRTDRAKTVALLCARGGRHAHAHAHSHDSRCELFTCCPATSGLVLSEYLGPGGCGGPTRRGSRRERVTRPRRGLAYHAPRVRVPRVPSVAHACECRVSGYVFEKMTRGGMAHFCRKRAQTKVPCLAPPAEQDLHRRRGPGDSARSSGRGRGPRPLGAQMSSGVKKSKKSAAAAQAQLISSPSAS